MAEPVPRVVLDTNVLVSALRGNRSRLRTPPVECLKLAQRGALDLVTSPALLAELLRVLAYPKLTVPAAEAHAFASLVAATAQPDGLVRPEGQLHILQHDPNDNLVLETALSGRADYLVTGNLRHFAELGPTDSGLLFRRVRILTPRQFLEKLEGGS